jgi:hypothetical protein
MSTTADIVVVLLSYVRHLFCKVGEILTNRKPTVFFNGEVIG